MFRRPTCLHLVLLFGATLPFVGACGSDLADGDFGGVDLQPFFNDTNTKAPPQTYTGERGGYLDGTKVKYYDFGWAAVQKNKADDDERALLGLGVDDRIPKVAPVNPMYFFFDKAGNPMFSAPVLEAKTGRFTIAGGKGVRNPNPLDNADKSLAYPVRSRDLLIDPNRKTADYQRPIVDVIIDRDQTENLQKYSGLWEVVRVNAPAGYEPDSIKSWKTLETGISSGDFSLTKSEIDGQKELLAINCPLIDARSYVVPAIGAYSAAPEAARVAQPLVELWYRRKRIDCFLVNGWESLGSTKVNGNGKDTYTLYKSSQDDQRVGVVDVDIFVVGAGGSQKRQLVAPLSNLYIPKLSAREQPFFVNDLAVTTGGFPRQNKGEPFGYRPIRWWWNIDVKESGGEAFSERRFEQAMLSDVRSIDGNKLSPRDISTTPSEKKFVALNYPLASRVITCEDGVTVETDPCRKFGMECGLLQGGNEVKICKTPVVRYGETCAPSVASCRGEPNKGNDLIETWFSTGYQKPLGTPGRPKEEADLAAKGVPPEWLLAMTNALGVRRIVAKGNKPLYSCLFETVSQVGTCYLSCDSGQSNLLQGNPPLELEVTLDSGKAMAKFTLDSRCGGALMPGFRCLPVTDQTTEGGGSFCMRECKPEQGESLNEAICSRETPTWFADDLAGLNASKSTTCRSTNLADEADPTKVKTTFGGCIRDPSFAPF